MKADERKEKIVYIVVWVDDENFVREQLSQNMLREEYDCRIISTISDLYEEGKRIRGNSSDVLTYNVAIPGKEEIRPRFMLKSIEKIEKGYDRRTKKENAEFKNKRNTMMDDEQKGENSFIVRNALQFIDEHYSERITLEEVAKNIYVSKWHLSKLLNKEVGRTFSQIINQVRIEKAKELLKDSSLRIGDVAELVGFLDISHFSRMFKKIEGISANNYRNLVA